MMAAAIYPIQRKALLTRICNPALPCNDQQISRTHQRLEVVLPHCSETDSPQSALISYEHTPKRTVEAGPFEIAVSTIQSDFLNEPLEVNQRR